MGQLHSISKNLMTSCILGMGDPGVAFDHSRCGGIPFSEVQKDEDIVGYLQGGSRIDGIYDNVDIVGFLSCTLV